MDTPPHSRDAARRPLRLTGRSGSETRDATPVLLAVFAGFAQGGAPDLRAIYRSAPVGRHSGTLAQPRVVRPIASVLVFELFTERTRQVVVLAQDDARALKHHYIGTEHLLLGLLREQEGLAARVLGSFGITMEQARAQVVRTVGQGDDAVTSPTYGLTSDRRHLSRGPR